jgi:hypothetical protein
LELAEFPEKTPCAHVYFFHRSPSISTAPKCLKNNQSMHPSLPSAPSFPRTLLQVIAIIATSAATDQPTVETRLIMYAKASIPNPIEGGIRHNLEDVDCSVLGMDIATTVPLDP